MSPSTRLLPPSLKSLRARALAGAGKVEDGEGRKESEEALAVRSVRPAAEPTSSRGWGFPGLSPGRARCDGAFLWFPRRSIIMTASSTLLALFLMPLCLWIYSRHWINTAVVQLLPLGAVSLTLGSTLLPIGLGVLIRYRHPRAADLLVKVGTAPGGEEGGHAAGDARGRHRGRGAEGSKLSGPSKQVLVSHRYIQLLRCNTKT